MKSSRWWLGAALCLSAGCRTPTAVWTGDDERGSATTVVYARTHRDYVRSRGPDGSFDPETYVLKNGGNFGGPRNDPFIDKLSFDDVRSVLTPALATQNYLPSADPAATDLVIVVFWGTTIVPDDANPIHQRSSGALLAQAERTGGNTPGASAVDVAETQRLLAQATAMAHLESNLDASINAQSANLLGYTDEIFATARHDPRMDLLRNEVEQNRYYVVLLAYAYPVTGQASQPALLWETRFSIPERRNDFTKELPMMASFAARFFGQDRQGLIRQDSPEGKVRVGEPKVLGVAPPEREK